jgi:importin subunit beta-1
MQQAAAVCAQLDAKLPTMKNWWSMATTSGVPFSKLIPVFSRVSRIQSLTWSASHLLQFIEVVFLDRQRYCFLFFSFLSSSFYLLLSIFWIPYVCDGLASIFSRDESVTKAAVAVMGDLADALGPNTKLLFRDRAFYIEFLGECLQSDDESIKETATWTQGMIGRVMVSCDEASWFVSTTAMSGFFFFFFFFFFPLYF